MSESPPPPSTSGLARRVLRGALYAGIAQYATLAIGIVKGMILARLIDPAIFGVVALAATLVSFFSLFRMELSHVVVSDPHGSQPRLVTQFILEVLTALSAFVLAGAVYLAAPWSCSPGCWTAIGGVLLIRLIAALSSTPQYILTRDIRQDALTRFTLAGGLAALVVAPLVALLGYPIAALLLDLGIPVVVMGAGAWLSAGWRPSRSWDSAIARDTVSFGFTLWTNGLLGKLLFDFDDWLVGVLRGHAPLGFYARAYNLAKMPMDVFAGIIGQLAPSLYSQSAAVGQAVLDRAYFLTTWLLARVVALSSIVMLGAAEELVAILLGPNWGPVVPLLRLMFVFVLARPLWQNNFQLLVVLRRERIVRRIYVVQAVIMLLLCPYAVWRWGGSGASVVVSLMMVVGLALNQWYTSRRVAAPVFRLFTLPLVLAAALTPASYGLGLLVHWAAVPALLLKSLFALALFGGATWLLERDPIRDVLALVADHLPRTSRAAGSDAA